MRIIELFLITSNESGLTRTPSCVVLVPRGFIPSALVCMSKSVFQYYLALPDNEWTCTLDGVLVSPDSFDVIKNNSIIRTSLTSSLYRLNTPNKTCDNDPIPTKIVKDCIMNSYQPFPTWLISRSVVIIFLAFGKRV